MFPLKVSVLTWMALFDQKKSLSLEKIWLAVVWLSTPFSFSSVSFSSLDQLVPCWKKLHVLEKGAEKACLLLFYSFLDVPWASSHQPLSCQDPAGCRFSGQPPPPIRHLHCGAGMTGQDWTTDPILTPGQRRRLAMGHGSTPAGVGRLWSSTNTACFVTLHICSPAASAASELSNIE